MEVQALECPADPGDGWMELQGSSWWSWEGCEGSRRLLYPKWTAPPTPAVMVHLLCWQLCFKNNSRGFHVLFGRVSMLVCGLFSLQRNLWTVLSSQIQTLVCLTLRLIGIILLEGFFCNIKLYKRQNWNAEKARWEVSLPCCLGIPLPLHTLLGYFSWFEVRAAWLRRSLTGNVNHAGHKAFDK